MQSLIARLGDRDYAAACVKGVLLALLALTLPAPRAAAQEGLPRAKPEEAGFSSERLHRVDEVVQRHIDEHRIAGAVTLVARKGWVVHFEAQGLMDLESKQPMSKDTLFRMASSTKPVTGVAILMLVEEGKVRLTDPVSKFIPEFKAMKVAVQREPESEVQLVAAEREITIRDLLTHTSGLGSGGLGTRRVARESLRPGGSEETLASFIPRLAAVPLDFQPGTRWRYSGLPGLDVLGRVVEVVSGQSYAEFLRGRIFEPLGMKDTFFVVPDDRRTRLATVYRGTEKGLEKGTFTLRFPKTYYSGAGGLTSCAADYFRFAQMLANRGELDGKRLLSPRAVELYSSNQVGDMFAGQLGRARGMGFGLSVEVVVDPVQAASFRSKGSFGWDGAFGTHFWVDPKEQLVGVFLVQAQTGPVVAGIQRDFETAVMQALVE
jgi:CubicO group peptidase (beta-lactamase class C family)